MFKNLRQTRAKLCWISYRDSFRKIISKTSSGKSIILGTWDLNLIRFLTGYIWKFKQKRFSFRLENISLKRRSNYQPHSLIFLCRRTYCLRRIRGQNEDPLKRQFPWRGTYRFHCGFQANDLNFRVVVLVNFSNFNSSQIVAQHKCNSPETVSGFID